MEDCPIGVHWNGKEFRISGGAEDDQYEVSLAGAFETLFARLHDRAIANLPDHLRIHAASGVGADGLFLLVGNKHAGKSTLAIHLLLEGYTILGDELVLLRNGEGVTFPRRFYLRPGSIALLPSLAAPARNAPFVNAPIEGRLTAIDPLVLGRRWRIAPARVATIIYLEPNHGGQSSVTRCGKVEMVQRVLPQCTPPVSKRSDWVADLCATINRANTVVLTLGTLASASAVLRTVLSPRANEFD